MSRVFILVVLAFAVALLGGCGGAARPANTSNGDVPTREQSYSTEARADGVRGGGTASDAEDLLEKLLEARGDQAVPDGALGDTAAWLLQTAYQKGDWTVAGLHGAACRFGFAGLFHGGMTGSVATDAQTLEQLVAQVPKNLVINRYGIVAGKGADFAIVLGGVEVTLDDFPRALAPGATLRLKGKVGERYQRTSIVSTDPDGKVHEIPMSARAIDAKVAFPGTGVHKLEIMGHGATGPVVLVNVPIHVGVSPPDDDAPDAVMDPNLTAEAAESILLSLVNDARTKRGVQKVEADSELRAVALAHSVDMTEHQFFGHVSPTTGQLEDRMAKAKLRLSKDGESIALSATPESALQGLLDSPAHRAGILDPGFTHVGIGVSFDEATPRRIAVTLLFGRRPPTDDTGFTPAQIVENIQGLRRARKLPVLRVNPVLTAAADAATRAVKAGTAKTPEQVMAVSERELAAPANRTRVGKGWCQTYFEMIDRYQISELPLLKREEIREIGVATAPIQTPVGAKLVVVVVADAGPGKVVKVCE